VLAFPSGKLRFALSETRVGAVAELSLTGFREGLSDWCGKRKRTQPHIQRRQSPNRRRANAARPWLRWRATPTA
jgi:hypothetical protein